MASKRDPELEDLYPELFGIISSYAPRRTSLLLSGVSRTIKQKTKGTYLEQLCRQDLKLSEIYAYLDMLPDRFGTTLPKRARNGITIEFHNYRRLSDDEYKVNSSLFNFYETTPKKYMVSYRRAGLHGAVLRVDDIKAEIMYSLGAQGKDIWSTVQLDVLSSYNILSKRVGCASRDSRFAKTRTKEVFELYYNDYKESLTEPRSVFTMQRIFLMMGYTNVNARALSITHQLEENSASYIFNDEGNIISPVLWADPIDIENEQKWFDGLLVRVRDEIERLVPLIHNAIDALP